MKKFFAIAIIAASFAACNGSGEKKETADTAAKVDSAVNAIVDSATTKIDSAASAIVDSAKVAVDSLKK